MRLFLRRTTPSRFFIIGSQRSGTTLMKLVMECHSRIVCHDEFSAYRLLGARRQHAVRRGRSGFKVPQLTEQFAASHLHDDEALRTGARGVPNPYRGEPLIFMLRDVRDVVASMLSLPGWVDRFGGPVLDAKIATDRMFHQRYEPQIEYIHRSPRPAAARCALVWRYKSDALNDYQRRGYPVWRVRYENLVRSPRTELVEVCRFLGVPWEETLLEHESLPHGELRPDGTTIGNSDPTRAIDTQSVDRWRRSLNDAELHDVLSIAGVATDQDTSARTRPCS